MAEKITKIVLDPGHGKTGNPAKVNGTWIVKGFYEGTNNFEAVQILKAELEKYENVEIVVTRQNLDDNPDLALRGEMGRDADLFFSWHSNGVDSTKAYGVSSFSSVRRNGKALCDGISKAVVDVFKANGAPNCYYRGYSQRVWSESLPMVDYYGVLRNSTLENPTKAVQGKTPIDSKCKQSIIIEHGFHSNPTECEVLADPAKLRKIVEAEAIVIANYFGLKKKEEPKPADNYYYFAVLSANKNKKYAEEDVAKAKKLGFADAYVKYARRDGAL